MTVSNELFIDTYNEYQHVMNIAMFKYARYLTYDERKEIKQTAVFDALRDNNVEHELGLRIRKRVQWGACKVLTNKKKLSIEKNKPSEFFDGIGSEATLEEMVRDMDCTSVFPNVLKKRFIEKKTLTELSKEYNCSHECIRSYINKLVKQCT